MIHYHGGPITPETCAVRAWKARHAFVSFARPGQIELAAGICQSFALDNGAFSVWRKSKGAESIDLPGYYDWSGDWLRHPACDFAVIPDVIGGTEDENDMLIEKWPHGYRGVPVWHLNESVERLVRLAGGWPRVALGSAAEWDANSPRRAIERMGQALPAITEGGWLKTKLHGLRMLHPAITSVVPLSSADSTNTAINHGKDGKWRGTYQPSNREARTDVLVGRIEAVDTPGAWSPPPRLFDPPDNFCGRLDDEVTR